MKYITPAVVAAVHFFQIIHPCLHALKLVAENVLVPVEAVKVPRDDAGRITPHAGTVLHPAGGNHVGHLAVQSQLLLVHIVEVFCVEAVGILQIRCRWAENLGIPRPSHPLVTLRAVGGHVQKIPLEAPADVGEESVDQRMPRLHFAPCGNIAVKSQPGEVLRLQILNSLYFHITVSVISKVRAQHNLFAV